MLPEESEVEGRGCWLLLGGEKRWEEEGRQRKLGWGALLRGEGTRGVAERKGTTM